MKLIHIFILASMLVACSVGQTHEVAKWKNSLETSKSVVAGSMLKVNSIALMPVSFSSKVAESLIPSAEVDRELYETIQSHLGLHVLSAPDLVKHKIKSLQDAKAMLPKYGLDSILLTDIRRYVKRQGSALGVTQPASVGFEMRLIRLNDGMELWRASFYNTDEPVSDNLLAIKDKVRSGHVAEWISDREMLRDGFKQAISRLAKERAAEFIR